MLRKMSITVKYRKVSQLYSNYMERKTLVTQQEIPNKELQFPSVTTCVDFWTNKTRLCELYPKNCTKKAMTIVMYAFFQQSIRPELRSETAFSPNELYRCRLSSCDPECHETVDCTPFLQMTTFRRPLQMCYTLDIHRYGPLLNCGHPSTYELELFGQMRPERTMELVRTDRIPLIVLESGVVPMTESVQIDLRRGFRHTIALKQQVVEGVPLPYNFACVDYRTMGPQDFFNGGIHTMESCLQECVISVELEMCNCLSYGHEFIANYAPHYTICSDASKGIEYCRDLVVKSLKYKHCLEKCRASCRELRYDLRLARISEMREFPPRQRDFSFEVTLRFATNRVEHLKYHPFVTYESVVACLGGSFGACIGIPLVTVALRSIEPMLSLIKRLRQTFSK
ncbi:uncharacterized protein LOC111244963 [Varroa destructor]|uniref:Uncharacterized protein n=1 Tax=Varroa destructor TaxID=109461 RepID=A0A7M7MAR0_VARDE|nr:uncharacterized protein LOC111244963 [Varroa destructor]